MVTSLMRLLEGLKSKEKRKMVGGWRQGHFTQAAIFCISIKAAWSSVEMSNWPALGVAFDSFFKD